MKESKIQQLSKIHHASCCVLLQECDAYKLVRVWKRIPYVLFRARAQCALESNENSVVDVFMRQVLLGKANVGKSSLVIRFVTGKFMDHMESTIGGTDEQPYNSPPTHACCRTPMYQTD